MTFQFRDDVESLGRKDLLAYVNELEMNLHTLGVVETAQGRAHLQRALGLTHREADLLALLADGRTHSKDSIMSAMYSDRIDDPPEIKIVDVFICTLRKKIAGSGVEIHTVWASGCYVTGTDVLDRLMAGETIEFERQESHAPVGRPAGGRSLPKGAVRDAALKYLRDNARGGTVRCTARELTLAAGNRTAGSVLIQNMKKTGWIEVRKRPVERGGKWTLRLTEKGLAG